MNHTNYDRRTEFEIQVDILNLDEEQKAVLKERWANQTDWYSNRSAKAKKNSRRMRFLIILCGALLPAIPTLANAFHLKAYSEGFIALVSVLIAVTAGVENFMGYADDYVRYRLAAERLVREMVYYRTHSGPLFDGLSHQDGFKKFVDRVELIMKEEQQNYATSEELKAGQQGRI